MMGDGRGDGYATTNTVIACLAAVLRVSFCCSYLHAVNAVGVHLPSDVGASAASDERGVAVTGAARNAVATGRGRGADRGVAASWRRGVRLSVFWLRWARGWRGFFMGGVWARARRFGWRKVGEVGGDMG